MAGYYYFYQKVSSWSAIYTRLTFFTDSYTLTVINSGRNAALRNKAVRGDQYVTLVVQVPTGLNEAAKEALRQFDAETGNSLKTQNGAAGTKKKKGFMGKIKESFDDL